MPRANDTPTARCVTTPEAVRRCSRDAGFLSGLRDIYRLVDAAVALRAAVCLQDGICCRFDLVDHRLYLSAGELALLTERPPPRGPSGPGRCPYQVGSRCAARRRRPLGCRVFFCDPNETEWSHATCERFHREIRALHERRRLPYAYVELLAGIDGSRPPP